MNALVYVDIDQGIYNEKTHSLSDFWLKHENLINFFSVHHYISSKYIALFFLFYNCIVQVFVFQVIMTN